MASIKVPQESSSLALSSRDPYSTCAELSFQFIFVRKCPFDSQSGPAQRETTWGGRRTSKASRFQLRTWLFFPRARGTRVESPGGIAVEGST
jgi:hypothetical protein